MFELEFMYKKYIENNRFWADLKVDVTLEEKISLKIEALRSEVNKLIKSLVDKMSVSRQ